MAAKFEAEVRTSIMALTHAVDDLAKSQKKAESASRKHVSSLTQGFSGAAKASGAARKSFDGGAQSMTTAKDRARGLTDALGRMGGPLGQISSQVGGGLGQGGVFGRMAIGMAAAAAAARALLAVENRQIENLRRQLEVRQTLNDAIRSGQDARRAGALGGQGSAEGLREVMAAGGQSAVDTVDRLSGRGASSAADIAAAVALAFRQVQDADARDVVLGGAEAAAATGEISMAEAVQRLAADPAAMRRLAHSHRELPAGDRRALHATLAGGRALVGDTGGMSRRDSDRRLARARDRIERVTQSTLGGDLTGSLQDRRRVQNQIETTQRDRFLGPDGAAAVREALAGAISPEARAQIQAMQQLTRELEQLRRLAEAESGVGAGMRNMGMLLGGEGSQQQQLLRRQRQIAEGALIEENP